MRVTTARRISQVFFLLLFVWLCVVSTSGDRWFEQAGWPVNWLLQLDPLVAIGVAVAAGTLTLGLLWALATIVLTVLFGRAFCGWLCPFGTMHQFIGWLGRRGKSVHQQIGLNRYRRWQSAKYVILAVMLGSALAGAVTGWSSSVGSLLTGLLDPLPLVHRSVNLAALPMADRGADVLWTTDRLTVGVWAIGVIFMAALALNLWIPRFYCRFICPLGALLGTIGRVSIFRIRRSEDACINCGLCERDCEGACSPSTELRTSECVMCLNCVDRCRYSAIAYGPLKSETQITAPDISRRGVLVSLAGGLAAAPLLRLDGLVSTNWPAGLIRPPGSLEESAFLKRCIKCGQCMRVCPTNVIQPAGAQFGFESLWTPVLNNRIGTSGCQYNCTECSHICPTGAIRPISLDEKLGRGEFAEAGPIRLGTAFVDRGRCLPWAMDRPCIVCQENCPVSPKAIGVQEVFQPVRDGRWTMAAVAEEGEWIRLAGTGASPDFSAWTTGDYFAKVAGDEQTRQRILDVDMWSIRIADAEAWRQAAADGRDVDVEIRLQRPVVDPARCIGCGVCEHECPVSGKRAIRVTAENETRSRDRSLLA